VSSSEVATFQSDATLAPCATPIEHDAPHDLESLIKAALRRCNTQ
jgi:hypothetical protein